jgi:hypothetical protein
MVSLDGLSTESIRPLNEHVYKLSVKTHICMSRTRLRNVFDSEKYLSPPSNQ